jgi:hypothetical protein
MEQLGIIKTDAEHQAGKTLGRWGDNLDSDGVDDEYGSEGSSDSGYEREPSSRTVAPMTGGRFSTAAAMSTPSAAAGTPSRGAPSASPLGQRLAGATLACSSLSGVAGLTTPAVSRKAANSSGLHWVSPGATAAKISSRTTPSGSASAGRRRQVTPGPSTGSTEAWRKLATELSNSTGQRASGSVRSKVRTTYATPTSSRSSGRRSLVPDRPSSPLQIPAAAAAAAAASAGAAAAPSEPFSFSRTSQSGATRAGPSTPAAPKAAVASKLDFSAAATPAATPAAADAGAGAASPALSPLWSTPPGAGSKAGEGFSPFNMKGNPLFGASPSSTPLAAVPEPTLNMGAAAPEAAAPRTSAAGGKPPAKPASNSGQPPEPPAMLQQVAQSRVSMSQHTLGLDSPRVVC